MLIGEIGMIVYRARDFYDMSRKAANILSAQVILKPNCVLGLATGSSPTGVYAQLIEWYKKGDIDFSEVRTINLDEYRGLSANDENSYRCFMNANFFDHINIRPANTFVPNGLEPDAAKECSRYEELIRNLDGIDMQLLGLGHNGHIGFNEPGAAFEAYTHCVTLTDSTRQANQRFFGSMDKVPEQAYTMGIKTIMQARRIVVIVSGESKAAIVKRAFFGPITPEVPASVLQLHNSVTLVGDEAALSLI
jgi:glucosamine-6-phosphate deaminase